MKALKIKVAIFLAIAVCTFILTQGIYRKNIGMLHDSLYKTLDIVEEMHVAESFHSSMHSMIIYASAYLHSKEERYRDEYNKKAQEGGQSVAQLVKLRLQQENGQHGIHGFHKTSPIDDEIAANIGRYFEELKAVLAPIIAGDDRDGANNLEKANNIFDEVFHKYYVKIHTSHYASLENLKNDAHHVYQQSNYIYFTQFALAIVVGLFLLVFAERVFLKIYKLTEKHSLMDSLTTLHNRRYLDTVIAGELEKSKIQGLVCSLILLDIDDFKKFNDTYGHVAGDKLLKDLAEVLRQTVRKADRLIRYGGEEFLVVLLDADKRQAAVVAEKIRQAIQDNIFLLPEGTRARQVTASFGIASLPEHNGNFTQAIKAADVLMYKAKREGKNRACTATVNEDSEFTNQ
ncbi:GGDEF domain-containing protein [Fundidesulfovibrio putealis]|uniref:GGDEF domain-containing protein n=1 Tax=Fundidesulfovibrio putealis TaxID=270496 RepID=UPI00041C36EC|nr:GGDEF domain-containing protein [Fundidesulfovibrio putealis]